MKNLTNASVRFPQTTAEDFEVTGFCHYHQDKLYGGESCYTCDNDAFAAAHVEADRKLNERPMGISLEDETALVAEYFRTLNAYDMHSSLKAAPVVVKHDNDLPF